MQGRFDTFIFLSHLSFAVILAGFFSVVVYHRIKESKNTNWGDDIVKM